MKAGDHDIRLMLFFFFLIGKNSSDSTHKLFLVVELNQFVEFYQPSIVILELEKKFKLPHFVKFPNSSHLELHRFTIFLIA